MALNKYSIVAFTRELILGARFFFNYLFILYRYIQFGPWPVFVVNQLTIGGLLHQTIFSHRFLNAGCR